MKILLIHQNFPGQFRHLVTYFAGRPECEVAVIGETGNMLGWKGINKVRIHGYDGPIPFSDKAHHYIRGFENHVRRGQAVARKATELQKSGFNPDVICVHTGWGEGMFLKDIFPDAKILSFCEFYYTAEGGDVSFDHSKKLQLDEKCKLRTRNCTQLLSFLSGDWGISPTHWQRSRYPQMMQERISVIHDGVDTTVIAPDPNASCYLPKSKVTLRAGDEVITFVNRNLEPYRGFHIFAKSLPLIQQLRPNAHVIIVGEDGVSYGAPPPKGTTFRKMFMAPVIPHLDMSKIHFVGKLDRSTFTQVLQVSGCHVYLTYPFVLSWSMIEAMSAGCLVVGSKTGPVEEVIEHGKNGLLVDFFSPQDIAEAVNSVFEHTDRMSELRRAARRTVMDKYDLHTVCLPRQVELITRLCNGDPLTAS